MKIAPADYSRVSFRSDEALIRPFGEFVVAAALQSGLTRPRILEIGCGDGSLLAFLLQRFPGSQVTGIDLSSPNILAARERFQACTGTGAPPVLIAGDYLKEHFAPHDLVVSHGTLHLVPGSDEHLYAKLAGEVADGGVLVFSMPDRSRDNRLLMGVRRVLVRWRGPALEAALGWIAHRWHGRRFSRAQLQERVIYSFVLPERTYSPAVSKHLNEQWGLALTGVGTEQVPLGKLRHAFVSFRKRPAVTDAAGTRPS